MWFHGLSNSREVKRLVLKIVVLFHLRWSGVFGVGRPCGPIEATYACNLAFDQCSLLTFSSKIGVLRSQFYGQRCKQCNARTPGHCQHGMPGLTQTHKLHNCTIVQISENHISNDLVLKHSDCRHINCKDIWIARTF